MSLIKRVFNKIVEEINKPDSFVKGEEFENYVRNNIFKKSGFELIHKTHDYSNNKGDYIKSSVLPDYKFLDKKNKKEFYVECKFRNGYYNKSNKIQWCNSNQLKRYKSINSSDCPVFIVLGFGDNGNKPHEITCFPISSVNWTGLYDSFLDKYSFDPKKSISSNILWKLK